MLSSALKLPDWLRGDYSISLGPILPTLTEVVRILKPRGLICVGDVVSSQCIAASGDSVSMILVYDKKTARKPLISQRPPLGEKMLKLKRTANAPGYLSVDALRTLCEAIDEAGSSEKIGIAVEVEGEEDLVALAALSCGPVGWLVVYGMPGLGAAIVPISPLTRAVAQSRVIQLKPELAHTYS